MEKRRRLHRTTILDIARETGFSIATVSRVINQTNTSYSEDTRKKVEEAIQRLNYKPDLIARNLKKRQSCSVALLTPQMDEFYTGIFNSMNGVALEKGYSVIWYCSQSNPDIEEWNCRRIRDSNYDGVIVATGLLNGEHDMHQVFGNVPVVLVEESREIPEVSRVYVDVEQLCRDAVQYLVDRGHRHIAYVSAPLQFGTLRDRHRGYLRGLRENGIPMDDSIMYFDAGLTRSDYECSYRLMRRILEKKSFSAMLVLSDWAAFTALKAAKELSIRVPEDLSIIGFDNLPFTSFSEPPLSTVAQDLTRMGKSAMEMMLRLIDGGTPEALRIEGCLVLRESVSDRPLPSTHD